MVSYRYDANGNLKTRTDARNVITSMTYDGQNRLTAKQYNDDVTPQVSLAYDTPCLVGRLCSIATAASATSYGYNALGQVTDSRQTLNGTPYPFRYEHDLQGNLSRVTYPSGRVVSYGLSAAGRVGSAGLYATNVTYAAHGALSGLKMGNLVQETAAFDARLRPVTIMAGLLLSVLNPYAANGNVTGQQINDGAKVRG